MSKIKYSHKEDYRNVGFGLFYMTLFILVAYFLVAVYFGDFSSWKIVLLVFLIFLLVFLIFNWIRHEKIKRVYGRGEKGSFDKDYFNKPS